jgi:hypothetical protein
MKRALALMFGPVAALYAACGSDSPSTPPATPTPDASVQDAAAQQADAHPEASQPACGTAGGALPEGLVELKHDDGQAKTHLREQTFEITVNTTTYALNEHVLHEAVRFELEHPARVHGFAVQWAALPADPAAELAAGLYADFGYNGFDFWAPDPLWTGTRCAGELQPGAWTTYRFAQPVELPHPGLVYVAHRAEPQAPVFFFDESTAGAGKCEKFDECHSALNLPEAETGSFFNGLSFSLQYDYLVRLYVEYTDQLDPAQRLFQPEDFAEKGHVSFGDYDDDGYDDLVTEGPTLYRNRGDGTFEDATASAGLTAMGLQASGGVWGDYDNDGCLDLLLYAESYTAPDTLLHSSCDGTFTDVTAESGIVDQQGYNDCGTPGQVRSPTAAAAFIDLDADGLLDIYFANFICWDKETYYSDTVFHNLGGGKFEDWSAQHGFSSKRLAGRGANPVDYDGDGDVDLFVNTYRLQPNLFFENNGDGTFLERAGGVGLAGEKSGINYFGHTIGAAWGDLDNDGDFDQVAANLAHPRFFGISDKTQVLLRGESGKYTDLAGDWAMPASAAGLRYQETHSVPALADFDNDGVLDLVLTAVYDGRPMDFYWGKGDGTFRLDAYHAGLTTKNGWGIAVSDIDNDGDVDVFAHRPFRNTLAPHKGHWLQVRAVGGISANRAALGATVRVTAAGVQRMRHVQGATGSGNQDSMYLHFGLGEAAEAESISVVFPGGKTVHYDGPFQAGRRVWVYEDGTSKVGWKP